MSDKDNAEPNTIYFNHPFTSALKKDALRSSSSSSVTAATVRAEKNASNVATTLKRESNLKKKKKKKKKKKALTWDEHAIEEHDLLRGTRMQIEEPNTPFSYYEHHSDEDSTKTPPPRDDDNLNNLAMNWNRLENKLDAVAAVRDMYPSSPYASSFERGSIFWQFRFRCWGNWSEV